MNSMTLDQRIEEDLKDLYNCGALNGEIKAAKKLQGVISDELSTKGMPGHFSGNRAALTVLVTLNPGKDAKGADDALQEEINKLNIDDSSGDKFVRSYIDGKANFGELILGKNSPQNNPDSFDVKQALFFKSWMDGGIFSNGFSEDIRIAVKEVLMNKLQLELIPYCSRNFKMRKKELFYEYVETLFDEIFSKKRKYVIFASATFETLFKDKERMKSIGAVVKFENRQYPMQPLLKNDGTPAKTKFNCTRIWITYKDKEYKAMIAPTFFKQGVAGDLMCQYGKFCYEEYNK